MSSWYYSDGTSERKGPLPEHALLTLIQKSHSLQLQSLTVWKDGMNEWSRAVDTPPFRDVVLALTSQWFYSDNGERVGPFTTEELKAKFNDGLVDGMTLFFGQHEAGSSSEWTPLSSLTSLREILVQAADEVEAELESGSENMVENAPEMDSRQVFVPDEQPTLPVSTEEKKKVRKRFVADDGTRYVLDEASGDWEEYEGKDVWKDDDDEEEERQQHKKQKKADSTPPATDETGTETDASKKKKKKKSAKKRGMAWNDKAAKKWIYITGLPQDVTEGELKDHFSKCGVLAVDPFTQKPKIKLYRDGLGCPKGDASICYAKEGSVDLATEVLDGGRLRGDVVLTVTRAQFEQRGETFDPSKRRHVTEAALRVAKAAEQQALTWNDDDDTGMKAGVRNGGLKIVVLEGMFTLEDLEDPGFEKELQDDLVSELEQKVGEPEKITIFEKNPKGVIVVKFKTAFAAESCVKLMNERFFAGRKLSCYYWDGVTDFTVKESEAAEEQRIDSFGDWIEEQELPPELQLQVED